MKAVTFSTLFAALFSTTALASLANNASWSSFVDAQAAVGSSYSPVRPPAVPLAVRSTYTNAWSSTSGDGTLNSNGAMFWEGSALGWEGIVTVDGINYEWMGTGSRDLPMLKNFVTANQRSLVFDSQYSNFTFEAGPIELFASFFSPVTPDDYCRESIPLSYLTVTTRSTDGASHDVKLYTDINGAWVTQPSAPLTWNIYQNQMPVNGSTGNATSNSLFTWVVQLSTQYIFGENFGQNANQAAQGVFPQWGNFTWSTTKGSAQSLKFQSGRSIDQRFNYVMGHDLTDFVDPNFRAYDSDEPVFAYEHELGSVGPSGSGPVDFTIGHVVQPAVRYLTSNGLESLQPWWMTCYGDFFSMVSFHYNDLAQSRVLASRFEKKLRSDVNRYYAINGSAPAGMPYPPVYSNATTAVLFSNHSQTTTVAAPNGTDQFGQQYIFNSKNAYGYLEPDHECYAVGIAIPNASEAESYYAIVALSARQIFGSYVLTKPNSGAKNQSEPLMFQKETSSNGNVNTVDVIFPAMPFFLWANPNMLRFILNPLFEFQETNFYPNSYSMHDLGAHFPNATGHVEGDDEYMPVEESGNMILMSYAIYRFSNNLAFLQEHYPILKRWAQYLIEYSLVPSVQLSTDDFAGQLANQTNLAIKGIVGLAAMGQISAAVGDTAMAANYTGIANAYYQAWEFLAIDPSERHTVLAYQWRSSWGTLYNVYPAKLLDLDIIPQSLYDMQSEWYPTVSQIFGVPLDSRHVYAKSDWEMWAAATCQPSTRRLFVDALAYWLNNTNTDLPFSDLYRTSGGEYAQDPTLVEFIARPVVGGHYSLLALLAAGTN